MSTADKLHEPISNKFFDESERLTAFSQLRDQLEKLSRYIDIELFRPELTALFVRST